MNAYDYIFSTEHSFGSRADRSTPSSPFSTVSRSVSANRDPFPNSKVSSPLDFPSESVSLFNN